MKEDTNMQTSSSTRPDEKTIGNAASSIEDQEAPGEESLPMSTSSKITKLIFIGVLLFLVLLFTIDSLTTNYSFTVLGIFVDEVENLNLLWLTIVLILATAFSLIICFPVVVLSMASGFVLANRIGFFAGVALGTCVNVLGNMLAALICFGMSTSILREFVVEMAMEHPYLKGIEGALEKKGFEINLYLRLSPVLPTILLNYGIPPLGTTFEDFMFGCFWGSLPYAVVVTLLGAMLDGLSSINQFVSSTPMYIVFVVFTLGAIFLVLGSWMLYTYANEAIDGAIREATGSAVPPGANYGATDLESNSNSDEDGRFTREKQETDRLLPSSSSSSSPSTITTR